MVCLYCDGAMPEAKIRRHAKFCNESCRKKRDYDAYRQMNPNRCASRNGATGAAHEMLVCADLLRKGYHVFRSVAPDGACDIIILQGKSVLRIEVKTSYKNRNGAIGWPNVSRQADRHDVLAVVVDGELHYRPESF